VRRIEIVRSINTKTAKGLHSMSIDEDIKKRKHKRGVINGLCVVVCFGIGLFLILLNTIRYGGWFIIINILLILCLFVVLIYSVLILCSLWLLKQPETVILGDIEAKERMRVNKLKEEGGLHFRFGRTDK
jgi:succinate dehydrogenase hydrophobic anchor subunit